MANVFVRSPYYVSNFDGSGDAAYGILTITIGGQVRYTLRKNYSSINSRNPLTLIVPDIADE